MSRADQGLCLFDLDHTLLHGDSDYLWGQFLIEGMTPPPKPTQIDITNEMRMACESILPPLVEESVGRDIGWSAWLGGMFR